MGKRGPKPRSTVVRRLEGRIAPGEENRLEPVIAFPPVMPDVVANDATARREWERLENILPPGMLTAGDAALMTAYCLAWSLMLSAQQSVRDDGVTVQGAMGGVVANPAANVMTRAIDLLAKLTDRMGLSPSARGRLELPRGKKEMKDHWGSGLLR